MCILLKTRTKKCAQSFPYDKHAVDRPKKGFSDAQVCLLRSLSTLFLLE